MVITMMITLVITMVNVYHYGDLYYHEKTFTIVIVNNHSTFIYNR